MARIGDYLETVRYGKHRAIIVRMDEPFNAGPPPELLSQSYIAPYMNDAWHSIDIRVDDVAW